MDLNQQSQPLEIKHKTLEQNDLFINAAESSNMTLIRHVKKVKENVRELGVMFDEGSQKRAASWSDEKKQKALRRFKLLRILFAKAKNCDDVRNNIDPITAKLKACKESNFCAIYLQTKPFEKSVQALELLHKNRDGQGRVKIIPVTAKRFVNPLNNFHLNTILKDDLEKEFYEWDIEKSPLYITYLGEIAEKSVIQELADMAAKTLALALVAVPSYDDVSDFLDFAEDFDIKGIDESLGHLVLPATQLVVKGCFDYDIGVDKDGFYYKKSEKHLAIPAGAAMMGALLASEPGVPITGKAGRGIKGTSGTVMAYNKKRLDSAALSKKGFIMIDKGKIFGARTANNSDKRELHHFPKVDTRNTIGKTLIQLSNDTAFGKWGAKERNKFIGKVKSYLNNQVPEVIESFSVDPNDIRYDIITNRVEVKITIKYKNIVEGIDFELEGAPQELILKS